MPPKKTADAPPSSRRSARIAGDAAPVSKEPVAETKKVSPAIPLVYSSFYFSHVILVLGHVANPIGTTCNIHIDNGTTRDQQKKHQNPAQLPKKAKQLRSLNQRKRRPTKLHLPPNPLQAGKGSSNSAMHFRNSHSSLMMVRRWMSPL
jgi:hypothetical protein